MCRRVILASKPAATMQEDRRLAAIMFTDMVGYTALMGADEDRAFQLLRKNREIHRPLIKKYHGKWLKEMGDGILASFRTATDAVRCAGEIQAAAIKQGIELRIGIHEGEVVFAGGDVLGDGVNIASRLEEMSDGGCISVSGAVYQDIKNKAGIRAQFIGEKDFKNVEEPVRVFRVFFDAEEYGGPKAISGKKYKPAYILLTGIILILVVVIAYQFIRTSLPATDRPGKPETSAIDRSIAVLPFANLSCDPQQEYFSDGIADEILMHLYKIGDLRVRSRTSVQQYKGTEKTSPQIGQELGVAHLLEGSVRKSENRVRITVQLIDARTDEHLWGESYDRKLEDIFFIQSDVARQIAMALRVELSGAVRQRIEQVPTRNMQAYELYLQASPYATSQTASGRDKAAELLQQAIELDPSFANAYSYLGILQIFGAGWGNIGGGKDPLKAARKAKPLILKALELDPENFVAHNHLSNYYLWFEWDFEKAGREHEKARELRPGHNWPDFYLASGRAEEAYREAHQAKESNPFENRNWAGLILSAYYANRIDEALNAIEVAEKTGIKGSYLLMESARVYVYAGKYEAAVRMIEILTAEYPELKESCRAMCFLSIAFYHAGLVQRSAELLEKIKKRSEINSGGSPSFHAAMIYAQMGEVDLAFDWLEKAFKLHEIEMYWLKVEPPFQPLHGDLRWTTMLKKIGFPDS